MADFLVGEYLFLIRILGYEDIFVIIITDANH